MKFFYGIQRKYGNLILLTPFLVQKEVIAWDDETIRIKLSSSADTAIKETVVYRLYSEIDIAVDAWIQELKYIPRLINSALTFLVVYFFLSLVVRDPIPMVDEFFFSCAATFGVYMWTAAKNRKSELATKKRAELKNLVDVAEYEEDDTLVLYEELLTQFDEMAPLTLADKITGNDDVLPHVELPEDSRIIKDFLGIVLMQEERTKKILSKLEDEHMSQEKRERLSARLLSLAKSRKIDLPLIALYRTL